MADTSKLNVKTAFQTPDPSRSRGQDVILSRCPPPKCHLLPYVTGGLSSLLRTVKYGHTTQDGETDIAEKEEGIYSLVKNGSLLGKRYQVLGGIGRGGSAVVIKARDTFRPGKFYVAIKILNKGFFALGYQESNCVRRLNQADPQGISGVVKLLNTFHFDGHYCMVYELMRPSPLHHYFGNIKPEEKLPLIRKTAIKLLQLLGFLQKQNVIHADLKPENILCVEGDIHLGIKVIDFGNAIHCVYDELALYYEDYELQTIIYRAPEVMCGLPFGTEVDLWSVGCILAELFIGRPLFFARSKGLILGKIYQLLGPLPIHAYQRGKFFQDFEHLGGPAQPFIETFNKLRSVLLNTTCADFVSFILGFLCYDIGKRMTVQEAIQHPFLAPELAIGLFLPDDQAFSRCYSKGISLQPSQYKHSPYVQKESQMKGSLQLLRNGTTGPEWSVEKVAKVVAQVTPIVRGRGKGKTATKSKSKVDATSQVSGSSSSLGPRHHRSAADHGEIVNSFLDPVGQGQSSSPREGSKSSPVGPKVEEDQETAEEGVQCPTGNKSYDSTSLITRNKKTDKMQRVKEDAHRTKQMYKESDWQQNQSSRQRSKGGDVVGYVAVKTPDSAIEQLQNSGRREVVVPAKRKRQGLDGSKVGNALRATKFQMVEKHLEAEGERGRKPRTLDVPDKGVTSEGSDDGSEYDVDDSHIENIVGRSWEKQMRSREKVTSSRRVVNGRERDNSSERTKVGVGRRKDDSSLSEDSRSGVCDSSKFGFDSDGKSKRNAKRKESVKRKVKLEREVKETSKRRKRQKSLRAREELKASDEGRKLVATSVGSSSKQRMAFEVYSQMEDAEFRDSPADSETGVSLWARKLDFGDSNKRAAMGSPGNANQDRNCKNRTKLREAEMLSKQKTVQEGAPSVWSPRSISERSKERSSLKGTSAPVSENCSRLMNKKKISKGKQVVGTNTVQSKRPVSIRRTQVEHKGEVLARSKTKSSASGKVGRVKVFEKSHRKVSITSDQFDKPQKKNDAKREGRAQTKKRAQTERHAQTQFDKSRKCWRTKSEGKVTDGEWLGDDELERDTDKDETEERRGEYDESDVPIDIIITSDGCFREEELVQNDFVTVDEEIERRGALAEHETPRSTQIQGLTEADSEPEDEEDEVLLL